MFQKYEKDHVSKLTEEEIRKNFKIVAEMKPVKYISEKVFKDNNISPNIQMIEYIATLSNYKQS